MKEYNHLYRNKQSFEAFLDGTELDRDKQALVRIHSCIHSSEEAAAVAEEIRELLPCAAIVGCSTSGVICDGEIIEDACLVSITTFDNCFVGSLFMDNIDSEKEIASELSEKLICGRKGFLLLFLPSSFTRGIRLVELMNRKNPGVKMLGGVAGYKEKKRAAYVLEGTSASLSGLSAAFISSDTLSVYENFVCGADSSGKSYRVTKSRRCCIETIDDRDGSEWYSDLLDKAELEKDPDLSILFPIIRKTDIDIPFLVKYRYKNEDKLNLYFEMPKDSTISAGYFNPHKTLEDMQALYGDLRKNPSEVLFAYDCQSRMVIMHSCAKWEVEQFDTTNISGALLGGEIVSRNNRNYFANFTFGAACLSENENSHLPLRSRDLNDTSVIQLNNSKAVNYLLASGCRQLNEELKGQQEKMKKVLFRSEALELDNQMRYLYERESLELDKIAMFYLSNERMLKLFVGRKEIYEELKRVYGNVTEMLRSSADNGSDIHIYSYETTSLLVAAGKSISSEEFERNVRRVLEYLNGISVGQVEMAYKCAVVENEKEPLRKAETALQYGAEHGLQYIEYSRVAEAIKDATEEIHILQVLRDALAEDRVIPYFQGIYDNEKKCFGLYESLMRIADKDGKIYYPNQFLPVAKKYNLYELLSVMMVKKVMEMFIGTDVRVTINLNVRDIYDREMIKVIFRNLEKAEHPENFIFELVESEEVTDYRFIKEFADRIHEKGAKVAIDDFGSGFSNLLHILRIDADYLKIDGEIIRTICDDEKCRQVVDTVNILFIGQNKQLIAEFVENEQIQNMVESMGIAYSQGYYFSKPAPWQEGTVSVS